MIGQVYNYLDMSIQKMSGFFATRVENLETIVPQPALRNIFEEKQEKDLQQMESFSL